MTVEQMLDQTDRHVRSTYSAIEASLMLRIAIIEEEKKLLEVQLQKVTERLEKLERLIGIEA